MGLETGTWIEDLVVTNPPSTDDKRQGDDHIRLIKSVLKNTLKRTSGRPVYFPTTVALAANYTILDTDENTIFRCNTASGQFTLTLPNTLTTANAGWKVIVVKTNSEANPVFIVPPSGTLDGFTKVRRTMENKSTEVMWTGAGWTVSRPNSGLIGSAQEYYGAALPNGHLWADGSTFVAADFAELNTVFGTNVKPDCRGRGSFGRDDMGGSTAGRITNAGSGIVGTTLKATGGTETHLLTSGQLPQHSHGLTDNAHTHGGGTLTTNLWGAHQHNAFIRDPGHAHTQGITFGSGTQGIVTAFNTNAASSNTGNSGANGTGIKVNSVNGGLAGTDNLVASDGDHSHSIASGSSGAATAGAYSVQNFPTIAGVVHQNMPPGIVCNKIIVAE